MKLKKLLAAASLVSLVAGTANALTLTPISPATAIVPALELNLPTPVIEEAGTSLTGTFIWSLDLNTGTYPTSDNVDVTITLPNGMSFASPVAGGRGGAAGVDVDSLPAGSVTNTVIVQNGGTGQNTVRMLVSFDDATSEDRIVFDFDWSLDACPSGPLVVHVETDAGNTVIEGGDIASNAIISPCRSAIDGYVTSDGATSDTWITLPSYTAIGNNFNAPGPFNSAGTVGFVNYFIGDDPRTAVVEVTPDISLGGLDFGAVDITRLTFFVEFSDGAGINSVTAGPVAATVVPGTNNQRWRIDATNAADIVTLTDGTPDAIVISVDGVTPIQTQTLAVTNPNIVFNDSRANLIPDEHNSGEIPADRNGYDSILDGIGALDPLQRQGAIFGFFDWNSETGPVNSVYRVTQFSAPYVDVPYEITITNSRSGNNGTWRGVVPAAAQAAGNGEVSLNSRNMFGLGLTGWDPNGVGSTLAGYDRGDVLLSFETADALDVDRLISSNGVVAPYGDGANNNIYGFGQTPDFDSDQFNGGE